MISIIICARGARISETLNDNINSTIGIPYELVIINNSDNRHSIFSAYNEGVKLSKYPYLCFMHDDIAYHTKNWGKKVVAHFKQPDTGIIGVAGSPYVTLMPGSWWAGGLVNINVIDWNKQHQFRAYFDKKADKTPVISVDGVWFCIKKDLFNTIAFDERNYKGFHAYDVDISFQVYQAGYAGYCVFDILIEHFSKGDMNQNWLDNAIVFKNKWKDRLPASCIELSYTNQNEAELLTLKEFVQIALQNKQYPKKVNKFAFHQLSSRTKAYAHFATLLQLGKYLFRSI